MEQETLVALALLPDALMGSCPIEGGHILIEHALELLLVEDQEVIQPFATNAAEKPFTDGVRSWGLIRCSEECDGGRGCHMSKARPELAIVITHQILRCLSIRRSFPERYALPRRRSGIVSRQHESLAVS
jgi:hypothetical protein